MNNKLAPPELIGQLAQWVKKNTKTPREQASLVRKLADGLCEALLADAPSAVHITAPNAVVEVVDTETGYIYRRYLELEYDESDNGLRLIGEDISGKQVQIAYLSGTALERLNDLRGHGPDAPRCEPEPRAAECTKISIK